MISLQIWGLWITLFIAINPRSKELMVATRVMQSSSNELSTPVAVSVNINEGKLIHMH